MIESLLILYIVAVTIAANLGRAEIQRASNSRAAYFGYVVVLVAFGAAPLVWIQQTSQQYSAMTVILVGVSMIWFAILASRMYIQTSR